MLRCGSCCHTLMTCFTGGCGSCCYTLMTCFTGGSQEVTLTFAPDHASDYFSDGVHVELFKMEEAYSFQVIGQAKEHIMFVTGGQVMKPSVESLLPMVTLEPDEGNQVYQFII